MDQSTHHSIINYEDARCIAQEVVAIETLLCFQIAFLLPSLTPISFYLSVGDKDGSKVTTVVATPGQGPDRPQEVSYTDTKVIGNGSFGVVYQAKLCDSGELVAIKKVLQDKRFKVRLKSMAFILSWSLDSI